MQFNGAIASNRLSAFAASGQIVSAPFTLSQQGNTAVVDGMFTLKRPDFAIGEGAWADFATVANEIQIKFHFLANTGK